MKKILYLFYLFILISQVYCLEAKLINSIRKEIYCDCYDITNGSIINDSIVLPINRKIFSIDFLEHDPEFVLLAQRDFQVFGTAIIDTVPYSIEGYIDDNVFVNVGKNEILNDVYRDQIGIDTNSKILFFYPLKYTNDSLFISVLEYGDGYGMVTRFCEFIPKQREFREIAVLPKKAQPYQIYNNNVVYKNESSSFYMYNIENKEFNKITLDWRIENFKYVSNNVKVYKKFQLNNKLYITDGNIELKLEYDESVCGYYVDEDNLIVIRVHSTNLLLIDIYQLII